MLYADTCEAEGRLIRFAESVKKCIIAEKTGRLFGKGRETMQALKQTLKAPENRELRIHLPNEVAPNTTIEVILIYGEPQGAYADKIDSLKAAMEDDLFRQDLNEVACDFSAMDGEDWEPWK